MNDLEKETDRVNKYTTGLISPSEHKYAFFFATNDNYKKKEVVQ